jgi:hypothetical protein
MKANLIGGTFMKKITLKRQPVFRRQPDQAVALPHLVHRLTHFIAGLSKPRDYLLELQKCLASQQYKVQSLTIKKIGTFIFNNSDFSRTLNELSLCLACVFFLYALFRRPLTPESGNCR